MFATKFNFHQILEWFENSDFHNLILFLPSLNPHDSIIEEHIIKNQYVIDRLTGNHTAYIYMDNSVSGSSPFMSIREQNIAKGQIRYTHDIVEEVSSFYDIPSYKLPALLVINKINGHKLYSIESERQLDDLLAPIGLITSYKKDKWRLESELRDLENVDVYIGNIENVIIRKQTEVDEIGKALKIISQDENLALRIADHYLTLLNYLKKKKVKENVLNKVFENFSRADNVKIKTTILELGVEESLTSCIENLINDLRKVINFDGFHSQYGSVNKQIERFFDLLQTKSTRIKDDIEDSISHLNKLKVKRLTSDAEIARIREEQKLMLQSYSKKLSETTFIKDPNLFFLDIDSGKGCLIDLLDIVYANKRNINAVLESLNQQVRERCFDTFISCKSEDYEKAAELYFLLSKNGYKPFLADKSLRQIGTDNYGYLIRRVIDQCTNMIVYASNVDYLETPYVSSEWNQFLDQISSGYIDGHLFAIIPPNTNPSELPAGLKTKQFFFLDNYKREIIRFLHYNEKEEHHWSVCVKEMARNNFEQHLMLFPGGRHCDEAKHFIVELLEKERRNEEESTDWNICLAKDELNAYQKFLVRFPESVYRQECLYRIYQLERDTKKTKLKEEGKHLNLAEGYELLSYIPEIERYKENRNNTELGNSSFLSKIKQWLLEGKRKCKEEGSDFVYSSVFAPAEVKPTSRMLTQVYLHLEEEAEKVKALATEADKNAERRDYIPLQTKLKKGDKVDVVLNINGNTLLYNSRKSIIWQGSFCKCAFDYLVPSDLDVDELSCSVNLYVNGAIIGDMLFYTQIVNSPAQLNANVIAKPVKKLFISYSHNDLKSAEKIAKLYEGMDVDVFFDKHRLKSGYIYSEEIFNFINKADTFVLCWSENAAQSEYVQKERKAALELAYPKFRPREDAKISIKPYNIQPYATPPVDMIEHYHFEEL